MMNERSDISSNSPNHGTNTDTLQRGEMTNITLQQNITDRQNNFSPSEDGSNKFREKNEISNNYRNADYEIEERDENDLDEE